MKRLITSVISVCFIINVIGLTSAVVNAAEVSYVNTFEGATDVFTWTPLNNSTANNTITAADAPGEGYMGGKAKKITYNYNDATAWGALLKVTFPSWNLSSMSGNAWVHFMAKGANITETPTVMDIYFYNVVNQTETKLNDSAYTFVCQGNEWEHIVIPVKNISTATEIRIYDRMAKGNGSILIDNFTITDTRPSVPLNYNNMFEGSKDIFTWSSINNTAAGNTMSAADAAGEGYLGGKAKKLTYNHNDAVQWGASLKVAFPGFWNMSLMPENAWLHFMVKGSNPTETATAMELYFYDNTGASLNAAAPYVFVSQNNEWEHIVIPIKNIRTAVEMYIYDRMAGNSGNVFIDNFTITDTRPDAPLNYVNTFEGSKVMFTWSSINNTTAGNTMSAADATGEGYLGGKAKKISYTHSGNDWGALLKTVFPAFWDMSLMPANAWLHFMAKVETGPPVAMTINFYSDATTLNASTLINSTPYTFVIQGDGWEHIILPTGDIRTAKAIQIYSDKMSGKSGAFLIDNFALTDAKPAGSVKFTNYFEPNIWGNRTIYEGKKPVIGTYTDFMKSEAKNGIGKDASPALEVSYSAASYNAGEVFYVIPHIPVMDYTKYLEFDVKSAVRTDEVISISLLTDIVFDGYVKSATRYTYRLKIDNKWRRIAIPYTDFLDKNGMPINPVNIGGISFTNVANGGIDPDNSLEVSEQEWIEKAVTGTVYFDNFSFTDTPRTSTVITSLTQSGLPLELLSQAVNGSVIFKADVLDYHNNYPLTMIVALYDKTSGAIQGFYSEEKDYLNDVDDITVSFSVNNPNSVTAKVIFIDNLIDLRPVMDGYIPKQY